LDSSGGGGRDLEIGVPDKVSTDEEGNVSLDYEEEGIQGTFYVSDNERLGSLTFESSRFVVQGRQVVGIPVQRLFELGTQGK
jgi:hypothetical protein